MKNTIEFLDKNRNKASVKIEITERNGYPELSLSGEIEGSMGQCQDSIKPANRFQSKLLKLWDNYHLKNISAVKPNIETQINNIVEGIEEAEDERKGKPINVPEGQDGAFDDTLTETTGFKDRDLDLCKALIAMFDLCEDDLQDIEIEDTRVCVQGTGYLAGTDSEMDEAWDESLQSYLDECVLPDLPEQMQQYFDEEKWKTDALQDGRAHSLNRYDGGEESVEINGEWFYAYQQ